MQIRRRYHPIAMNTRPVRAGSSRVIFGGLSGRAHVFVLGSLMVTFALGGYYLYSVNQSAVQGYHIRTIEKEISALKEENSDLKITEADLRSFQRIETASEDLMMQQSDDAKYLEARGPVAMR